MSRFNILSVYLLPVILCCQPALAANEVNGFGSFVAGKVIDGNEYLADYPKAGVYDTDLSFSPDSLIGVQFRSTFNDRTSLVAQLVASSAGDNNVAIDGFYVSYSLMPGLSLQAGRKQLPLYYYSDYFDVGYAYYWIRPPSDLYTWQITNYNGVSLLYQTTLGEWNTSFNLYYGSEETEENELLSLLFSVKVDEEWNNMLGIVYGMSNEWLDVRISHMQGLVSREINGVVALNEIKQQFLGLSINLTLDNVLILSEFNKYELDANFDVDTKMLSIGYQIGDFTPHITRSAFEQADQKEKHDTTTVGLRWDITDNSAIKLQYDDVVDEGSVVSVGGDSRSITIGVDVVF